MTLGLSPEELRIRHKQQQISWREIHPDRVREYHRKHHARPEVKQHRREWQQANRERLNARRRELYRMRHPLSGLPAEASEPGDEAALDPALVIRRGTGEAPTEPEA